MKPLKVHLKEKEVGFLDDFVKRGGGKKAREIVRANILLLSHKGKRTKDIEEFLGIERKTIWRIKKRYLERGIDYALKDKPRPGQPKKYTEKHEAEIIALACSKAPEGFERWSLQLMTSELKKKKGFETMNRESVRLVLKKAKQNHG